MSPRRYHTTHRDTSPERTAANPRVVFFWVCGLGKIIRTDHRCRRIQVSSSLGSQICGIHGRFDLHALSFLKSKKKKLNEEQVGISYFFTFYIFIVSLVLQWCAIMGVWHVIGDGVTATQRCKYAIGVLVFCCDHASTKLHSDALLILSCELNSWSIFHCSIDLVACWTSW